MEESQGKREGEEETGRERDREVMTDTEKEREGERAGGRPGLVSPAGYAWRRTRATALVLCPLVPTDVLGTYSCAHICTCTHARHMCPRRCGIVDAPLCLPVRVVSAQMGLRVRSAEDCV